jgi:predicted nucleic acid-binding protein
LKACLDTNIFAYAGGVNDLARRDMAIQTIRRIKPSNIVIPVQALGELYNVLTKKNGRTSAEAVAAVREWLLYEIAPTTPSSITLALDLAQTHDLQIWDCVMLAAAVLSGCEVLLTEDLQHGAAYGSVVAINPFTPQPHPLLAGLWERS